MSRLDELISRKNGLPIRRGVILIAGPNNDWDAGHWHYYVVNPDLGHVLDPNNNVMIFTREQMQDYWVGEWRSLPHQDWWQECANGLDEGDLYHSGICAGCEDGRF